MLRNIPKRGARIAQPRSEATKAKRYNHCWVNVRKYSPNITALEKPYTCQDSFMFLYMVILKMITFAELMLGTTLQTLQH